MSRLFILFFLIRQVFGSLSLVQPLQAQTPLIARVGQAYSWTFNPPFISSRSNSSSGITYNATNLPHWLSFDPNTHTFSGTPQASDIGDPVVQLEGKDGESSCWDKVELCITDFPAPRINYTAQAQFYAGNPSLSSVFTLAPTSALASADGPSLRVPPSWSFSVGFDFSTFTVAKNQTLFYSASALPSWLSFDHSGLSFDGVVPKWPLNTTYSFKISLFGSDQHGFSAVNQTWNLIVAAHELGQTHSLPTFNLTAGQKINEDIRLNDLDGIVFDNKPLGSLSNLSASIDTSCCSWMTASNFSLSGKAPSDPGSFVLPVSISDSSVNQTLHTSLNISVISSAFTQSELPSLSASPGSQVSFNLQTYLVNADASNLNITISAPGAPWLVYNPQTFTLSGKTPKDIQDSKLTVKFSAKDIQSGQVYVAQLPVTISKDSQAAAASGSSSTSPQKLRTILGSVFGSIAGFVILCGLAACCRAHHNRRKGKTDGTYVIDQRGQGYWREKGALDAGFTYAHPSNPSLKSSEPAFEEVRLTPMPSDETNFLEMGAPPALMPGAGRMRKGEFFARVKNSLTKKTRKRPLISNPMPVIIPSDKATVSHVVNSIQGSYINSSFTSHSTELEIAHEKATQRRDFMPPNPNRSPFVPRPSPSERRNSFDSLENDLATSQLVSAEAVSMREGKPRLVEFKQAKKGSAAAVSKPAFRNVSHQGIVGTSLDPSDAAGPSNTIRMVPSPIDDPHSGGLPSSLKSMHVRPNQPFSWAPPFAVPPSHPNLRAFLEDGRKLPTWLKFEPNEGEFWGIWYPASPTKLGTKSSLRRDDDDYMVVVVQAGHEEVGRFMVVIDS